jgi:glycosyltransferase involved in cell wall biosynthesis
MARVVHVLTFLDSQTGGMERQALQLAQEQRTRGDSVWFITSAHVGVMRRNGLSLFGSLGGIEVVRIPFFRGWRRWNAIWYAACVMLLLVRRSRTYDIIHAHQLHTSGIITAWSIALLRKKYAVIKVAAGGATGDVHHLQAFLFQRSILGLLNQLRIQCVGVSSQTVQELRSLGVRRVVTIPNGVDLDRFSPSLHADRADLRAELFPLSGAHYFVCSVGRFTSEKGHEVLIDALAQLPAYIVGVFVGTGPLLAVLQKRVRQHRMTSRVLFVGTTDHVEEFYAVADCFVLPSYSEGMPNALLEAMAVGLPVVASRIPATSDIVQDGEDGMLVSPGDARLFAGAILRVCEDVDFSWRIGAAARRHMEESYDLHKVANRYATLYANLFRETVR